MFEDIYRFNEDGDPNVFSTFIEVPTDNESEKEDLKIDTAPIVALKNTVLFPTVVLPISIKRDRSRKAIEEAHKQGAYIGVVSQKNNQVDDPKMRDLYTIGTLAKVVKVINMPDGSITAVIQGKRRFELQNIIQEDPFLLGHIRQHKRTRYDKNELELRATVSSIKDAAKKIIDLSPQIPSEAILMINQIDNESFLIDFIAANINSNVETKQSILEETELLSRAKKLLEAMSAEIQLLEVKYQIENKVKNDIEKNQRDYLLNQQLKMIQEELGENNQSNSVEEFKTRAADKNWPEKVQKIFDKEIEKLQRLNPQQPDYGHTINYVELLLDLPWESYSEDQLDLDKVKQKLDEDHFGLDKVKKRILEYLSVLKLKGDMKSPILCLVGPPGVGKTSLGKSISEALGRKFVRMSFGGLHDEAEIRGHRRTYIGSMPGRIIQGIKKSEFSNPVFILDEVDKIGKDFRGDPSSALLEVLDPEQNSTFQDNYLETEYDLSKVMFIATANSLSSIQPALLDRMEIIDISGYSVEEKVEIAKKYLVPKQLENHGLQPDSVSVSDDTWESIIQGYTRESGVRSLDRVISQMMRYVASQIAMKGAKHVEVTVENLEDVLGTKRFSRELYKQVDMPGVAVGLAWTQVGGDILFIEASTSKGKGKLTLTGNLGDVMKESATTALSFLKANAEDYGLDAKIFDETDIHIHVPEGAIPKDGPSAGITMMTALYSALSGKPVKPHLAMTGEITLRGSVLPVGGIKEKVLAAKRAGIQDIIMCEENRRHVNEIEEKYIKDVQFHFVNKMSEVLQLATA